VPLSRLASARKLDFEHPFTSDQVRRNNLLENFLADFEMNSHLATF